MKTRNMRAVNLTLLVFVLLAGHVLAQGTYRFRHVGIEDGLSQGSVYHMLKDSQGFLWLGSQDGINRFNGKNFEVYLSGASGESTNIQGIAEDKDGTVWIGSHKGMYQYNRKRNKFIKHEFANKANIGSVHAFMDRKKNVFFLSEAGLFSLINNDIHLITDQLRYSRSQFNNFVATTPGGEIWLLNPGKGVMRYSHRTKKTKQYFANPASDTEFSCITADRKGDIWLGGRQKLIHIDCKSEKITMHQVKWPSTGISLCYITEDLNGKLWLATEKNGIILYDPLIKHTIQQIQHEDDNINSLKFNEVSEILIDENNDVFANTDPQGIDIITSVPSAFACYSYGKKAEYNLSGYSVRGLAEDENDDIWLGTELGGLNRLTPSTGKVKHYTTKDGLPDNIVRYVLRDPSGSMWVATLNGLALYIPESESFRSFELPVFCEVSNFLSLDSNTLLLITSKGIMLFDKQKM
ncbi:MAG TPA: two-component regulator propeller domain-containing protein, partial [Dyadobacter sp.]|nr:two-component regulator propeller domain-containing protein [Dyadobacter sp.]